MNYEETTEEAPFTPEMEAGFRQIILDRAPAELEQLAAAVGDSDVFTHLPSAAAAAFHLGQLADAKAFAERALTLAPEFEKNWNYGNALHLGRTVLGLIALNEQDHSSAIRGLHE